jgi:hypothetical protein
MTRVQDVLPDGRVVEHVGGENLDFGMPDVAVLLVSATADHRYLVVDLMNPNVNSVVTDEIVDGRRHLQITIESWYP